MNTEGMHIEGLMQDCSNSIATGLELPESCTEPGLYSGLKGEAVWSINLVDYSYHYSFKIPYVEALKHTS